MRFLMMRSLVPSLLLFLSPVVFAADPLDVDDLLGDEKSDDSDSSEERLDSADDIDLMDSEEEFEFTDDEDDDDNLLGEEEQTNPIALEGSDTAALFRAQQDLAATLPSDEAVQSWEGYLEQFPNTVFRDRIVEAIDGLMTSIYSSSRVVSNSTKTDALEEELYFAQSILLENLNPRTKIQAGFEWGLPSYMNLIGDYEYAILRNFSVHGGLRHRYTGWSAEAGARMAVHKSLRTQSILTVIGDLHFNTNPAFIGLRPQLAYGQRFGDFDVQAQAGIDLELRKFAGLRVIGGANITYRAAETVGLFLETSVNMKNFEWESGPFRFNVVTFGMKFFPSKSPDKINDLEVNMGTSVPYTSNYWMYHYGSIMAQTNYYL
jgi:hypothetical protein